MGRAFMKNGRYRKFPAQEGAVFTGNRIVNNYYGGGEGENLSPNALRFQEERYNPATEGELRPIAWLEQQVNDIRALAKVA